MIHDRGRAYASWGAVAVRIATRKKPTPERSEWGFSLKPKRPTAPSREMFLFRLLLGVTQETAVSISPAREIEVGLFHVPRYALPSATTSACHTRHFARSVCHSSRWVCSQWLQRP